jgi:dTDP-4-dehydrorhamnose reductase
LKKLLVTGISGFLGWHVARFAQQGWQIVGTFQRNRPALDGTLRLDLKDRALLRRCFEHAKPDAVLHLGAISSPNSCELQPDLSYRVNVMGSVALAEICAKKAIPLVFASTDLVFGGKNAPYTEDAAPDPICTYGKHKAQAEREVLSLIPDAAVARLPLMYGLPGWGSNFLANWLHALRNNMEIKCFSDEYRTATSGRAAAEGLFLLLDKQAKGIFHLGGGERLSRYEFALKMAAIFGLDPKGIASLHQADIEMPAPRPKDVSLQSTKLLGLGFRATSTQAELERLFRVN